MIGFIRGIVCALASDYILIDHDGIGFRINFYQAEKLKINDTVTIYTYQNVREDEISLYGFLSLKEYDLFIKLISVKGLGPKIASQMIARSSADQILDAIASGDVAFIKSMPGIGAKTASQIILDLKGKLVDTSISNDPRLEDAKEALRALGFKNNEFNPILKDLSKEDLSTEELISKTLSLLAKNK